MIVVRPNINKSSISGLSLSTATVISEPYLPPSEPMTESTLSPMATAATAKVSDAQANLPAETQGLLQNIQNEVHSEAEDFVQSVENKVVAQSEGYMQKVETEMARDLNTLPSLAHRHPPNTYIGPARGLPRGLPRGSPRGVLRDVREGDVEESHRRKLQIRSRLLLHDPCRPDSLFYQAWTTR